MPDVNAGTITGRLRLDTTDWKRGLDKSGRDTKRFTTDAEKGFSSLTKTIQGLGLAYAAKKTAEFSWGLVKLAADAEQTSMAFTTLLGSTQAAEKHLAQLRDFAAKTPFEFTDLTRASRRMQALGFEAGRVIPMLTSIGDTAAAMGEGAVMVDRVTLALGQMNAKTKVSAGEMLQLTEAGIPAWEILSKAIGKSTSQTMELATKGVIPADKAIKALLQGMSGKFGDSMAEQSKTFNGKLSNTREEVAKLGRSFGEILLPKATEALDKISDLVGWINKLPKTTKEAAVGLGEMAAVLGGIALAIASIGRLGAWVRGAPGMSAGLSNLAAPSALGGALAGTVAPAPIIGAAVVAGGLGAYWNKQSSGAEQLSRQIENETAQGQLVSRLMDDWRAAKASGDPKRLIAVENMLWKNGYDVDKVGNLTKRTTNIPKPGGFDNPDVAAGAGGGFDIPEIPAKPPTEEELLQARWDGIENELRAATASGSAPWVLKVHRKLRDVLKTIAGKFAVQTGIGSSAYVRLSEVERYIRAATLKMTKVTKGAEFGGSKVSGALPVTYSKSGATFIDAGKYAAEVPLVKFGTGATPYYAGGSTLVPGASMDQRMFGVARATTALDGSIAYREQMSGLLSGFYSSMNSVSRAMGEQMGAAFAQALARRREMIAGIFAGRSGGLAGMVASYGAPGQERGFEAAYTSAEAALRGMHLLGKNKSTVNRNQRYITDAMGAFASLNEIRSGQGGWLGGAMSGASMGASIGSYIPGGTLIGAGIGALAGAIFGGSAADERRHQEAQEMRQRQIDSLNRTFNELRPMADYFRTAGLHLLPGVSLYGSGLAMDSALGG